MVLAVVLSFVLAGSFIGISQLPKVTRERVLVVVRTHLVSYQDLAKKADALQAGPSASRAEGAKQLQQELEALRQKVIAGKSGGVDAKAVAVIDALDESLRLLGEIVGAIGRGDRAGQARLQGEFDAANEKLVAALKALY